MLTTLAVGHVTHDRFGDDVVAGGSVLYASLAWQALGADARVLSAVGEDFAGEAALDGVAMAGRRSGRTTVFHNLYPDSGPRVQWVETVAPPVEAGHVPADWQAPDVAFLAPVIGEVPLVRWRQTLAPRLLAIGVQGWIKRAGSPVPGHPGARRVEQRRWEPTADELAGVDVALLSEEDLIGQGELLARLRAAVPLVVLTKGARGCRVYSRDGELRIGAYPVDEVDPTGAGDTFAAGFLLGLRETGRLEDAARLGAAAASVVVERVGPASMEALAASRARAAQVPIL